MVGAIDGLAITITAPTRKETSHQLAYRSGSKMKYCLNMQAICDADLIFEAVTCMHAGSTNDVDAFNTSALKALCESLPFPYHYCGDGAYCDTEQMMTPYAGTALHLIAPEKDSFNFWHSQVRITIERCFGVFVRRWGILWKPMAYRIAFVCKVVHACARLHNYCEYKKLPLVMAPGTPDIPTTSDGAIDHPHFARPHLTPLSRDTTGNTLKENITAQIMTRQLFHSRSHLS